MAEQVRIALRILRRRQVEARTGLARSTLYDRLNPHSPRYSPSFPKPIKLGEAGGRRAIAVGWIESEIDAWIESCATASRKEAAH